jgi:excinuclease ABC subunit A
MFVARPDLRTADGVSDSSSSPDIGSTGPSAIRLRGVRVHNLRGVDVDIPLRQLTVLMGVSGSGKSSLAVDTLYAEGQRRYIESFSAQARQHLDRLEKPDADAIENLPPAVAIRQHSVSRSAMSTVATVTGIDASLRQFFARLGTIVCPGCSSVVRPSSVQDVVTKVECSPDGTRLMLGFVLDSTTSGRLEEGLPAGGFTRGLVVEKGDQKRSARNVRLDEVSTDETVKESLVRGDCDLLIVVDRVVVGRTDRTRLTESLETCIRHGEGRCIALRELPAPDETEDTSTERFLIDGKLWGAARFSTHLECTLCDRLFQRPTPQLLNFYSPAGACRECSGVGQVPHVDWQRLVPDANKTLKDDAISLLSERRWRREKTQLLELCHAESIPIDEPFCNLDDRARAVLRDGSSADTNLRSPQREPVLAGLQMLLFRASRQSRPTIRNDVLRWAPPSTCPACSGSRLNPESLAIRLGGTLNVANVAKLTVDDASDWLARLASSLGDADRKLADALIRDLQNRLRFLRESGLGYLEIGRPMSSMSLGEARRVSMAAVLGSSLVNTLFVLDEPSAGQHPRDSERLLKIVQQLRDAGNTIVAVEHQRQFIDAADHVIELGPGAGRNGGTVTHEGPAPSTESGSSNVPVAAPLALESRRNPVGSIVIENCRHHTLQNISVEFPLGCLCVVTGVSGSGKSSLVEQTLFPALCESLGLPCTVSDQESFGTLSGADQIGDVQLVSAERLSGGHRSNPATWLKIFDGIRQLFAETQEARSRDFTPATFSFNTDTGGRCSKCKGTGRVEIDMQFLSDVVMTCPECHGTRYQRDILDVSWRSRSIADVLAMTTEEAFSFFRGQPKIQKKLQSLKEVGLGYLTLGQPLSTLSGGEAQRLKLASSLAATGKTRSLLILTEPATGLHPTDTERLLDCFDRLLSVGHSLVVIEHNPQVIRAADHIIDLGPEAGPGGGTVVAKGSLQQIQDCPESLTGRWLSKEVP